MMRPAIQVPPHEQHGAEQLERGDGVGLVGHLQHFHRQGGGFAAADAQAGDAALQPYFLRAPSRGRRCGRRKRRWVAQGAGAAVDVDLFRRVSLRSCMAAMVTVAKASLISKKSTWSVVQPVLANSFWHGAHRCGREVGRHAGVWWPTMRAMGRPSLSAREARIRTRAAAPSEIDEELAGVTVPSFRKAGLRGGFFDIGGEGCSSSGDGPPRRPSAGDRHRGDLPGHAAVAVGGLGAGVERMAKSSWASREKP